MWSNGLVHRYHTEETPDGIGGGEGALGLCTFWLVDALALSGRVEEAQAIFEGMLARANDLGLYAEEIDSRSGEFLGNVPQAFTHVGLINAAHYLGQALTPGASGSPTHRTSLPPSGDAQLARVDARETAP
ncbi:MAG TPA: glycoside hydrolase family 15 protein [Longimicrobiaceae bacterium]|nr:glycoside hydrolase family 15 protein [Longimicrobiaceae bacterium]